MKPGVLTGVGTPKPGLDYLAVAAYLHSRITRVWLAGANPAILASAKVVVVWICYLGVNLFWAGVSTLLWLVLLNFQKILNNFIPVTQAKSWFIKGLQTGAWLFSTSSRT